MEKHVKAAIQGKILEVNVVGCRNLSDKEWFSRQDPYVVVEYAGSRFRTRTDTDGGKNPSFNEKFQIPLIEGLREMNLQVWNSNTISLDDYIGTTKVLLDRVLSTGYDSTPWQLKSRHGRTSGEVNLILHFSGSNKKDDHHNGGHSVYPPVMTGYPATSSHPTYGAQYPPTPAQYPPPAGYPPAPAFAVPQGYPPVSAYPAPHPHPPYPASAGYPVVPPAYPPAGYPPPGTSYPASSPAPGGYPPVAPHPHPGSSQPGSGGYTVYYH